MIWSAVAFRMPQGFKRNKAAARIHGGSASASAERLNGFYVRIALHPAREFGDFGLHRLEGNTLIANEIAVEPSRVLLRKEALGNDRRKGRY